MREVNKQHYQVVVRAGTSLGNILLNVLISEGIPVERVGKNNVMVWRDLKESQIVLDQFDIR